MTNYDDIIKEAVDKIRAACVNLTLPLTSYSSQTLNVLDETGAPHSIATQHVYALRYNNEEHNELISVTIVATHGKI